MRKLINGIVAFHSKEQREYLEKFGRLSKGQEPDALLIACSDSRVAPNTFASTDPGDLFVVRNVGNLIPPVDGNQEKQCDDSAAAAIEFSVNNLNITDIIICGHSDCGAMHALLNGRSKVQTCGLRNWLRHGDISLQRFENGLILDPSLSKQNQLSQVNVLAQMDHVASYPAVKARTREGTLKIHGWWFNITTAEVYYYEPDTSRFEVIDETSAARILERVGWR